jgi:hypothetical protein
MAVFWKQFIVAAALGTAGSLALSEPFYFGLRSWFDWVWWLAITAAYFFGAWLLRRDQNSTQISN